MQVVSGNIVLNYWGGGAQNYLIKVFPVESGRFHIFLYKSWKCTQFIVCLAVNSRTVLAIVPPQGCEVILIEILQPIL